jgi:osmoprotectant transport system ATP-binding protein
MFKLDKISKSFDGTQVLKPCSLEFKTGETSVLIGPSGCGKSTLLRLLAGLIQPDLGTVFFENQPLSPASLVFQRRRMGYVIQEGGLFPHLTALGNITLLASRLGMTPIDVAKRVEYLASLTRLPMELLNRYPGQLSGGQRQRVGIMRALMLDPPVLLLDEPMGALDPLVRYDLQEDLRAIIRSLKKTAILVTHDMGEASFFGDRLLLLNVGEIVQEGHLDDFITKPSSPYVTRFINAQRMPHLIARTAGEACQ